VFAHALAETGLVFILAGALGNFIDRAARGYVIDMFSFEPLVNFPVFNVADACVTCGAVMFVLYYLFLSKKWSGDGEAAENGPGIAGGSGGPDDQDNT